MLVFLNFILNFSRVSEVTLGPFVGFLCYVVGTKLGGVLLLRMREMMYSVLPLQMRQKAMQLVLVFLNFSRVSEVTLGPFLGFLCYVLGTKLGGVLLLRMHEMMWYFAVADASESYAARAFFKFE